MVKLVFKQMKENKLINFLFIIIITISIITFTIGTEYINFFYQKQVDLSLFKDKTETVTIELNEEIGIKEVADYINSEEEYTIISGEIPILERNKRIFLAGINNTNMIDIIPIYSGEFFNKEELKEGKFVCVIGYAHKDLVFNEGDNEYIEVDGIKLLVKGVIGRDTNSYWNGNILVPINTLPKLQENFRTNTIEYMLLNKEGKNEVIEKAKLYFNNLYKNVDSVYMNDSDSVLDIIKLKKDLVQSLLFILIIAFVNLLSITVSWYKRNKRALGVYCLIGFKKKDIIIFLLGYFILLILPAIILSSIISISLESILSSMFAIYMKFKIVNLVLGIMFSGIIAMVIISLYYIFLIRGKYINEVRGR